MEMSTTALTALILILIAAVAVFFSQDFMRLSKRIMKIPGALLLLPLFLASALVVLYEDWIFYIFLKLQEGAQYLVNQLTATYPQNIFVIGSIQFLLLFGISVGVIALINLYIRKTSYKKFTYRAPALFALWFVLLMIIVIPFN